MAALDKGIARRIKQAAERFAETGAGSVKKLQGIYPPSYRLRVGDDRVRFELDGETVRIPRSEPPRSLPLKCSGLVALASERVGPNAGSPPISARYVWYGSMVRGL